MANITETDVVQKRLKCELGVLSRPEGSASLSQGDTIMLAAVYGPYEAKLQHMQIDKAFVEVHYRPKAGIPGVTERLRESIIRNTCETALMVSMFPRTTVTIVIQEVQNCGELIGCAVNAACLALMDTGIDMKFLVAGVTCAIDSKGNLNIEPDTLELEKATATCTLVFENVNYNIVTTHTRGMFTEDQYKEAVERCRAMSVRMFDYYRNIYVVDNKSESRECDE